MAGQMRIQQKKVRSRHAHFHSLRWSERDDPYYGSTLIPETDKTKEGKSPEDSLYTSSDLLIVADDVGGWSFKGVDSGIFSGELVRKVANDLRQSPASLSLKSIL